MILIGQFDSPFVRRVGIALRLYGIPFEHQPWSVFGDADRLRAVNPLTRVPTLVLDEGEALVDSPSIIDHLDMLVPEGQALFPRQEPARRRAMRVTALACGLGDKAVSLFYEKRLHAHVSDIWVERCRQQIGATLAVLEAECPGGFWFGGRLGHADIAVAAIFRFLNEAHPGLLAPTEAPGLRRYAAALEALPVFQEIQQPFIPPA